MRNEIDRGRTGMNRKGIALLLVAVMLLCIGCGKKNQGATEPAEPTLNTEVPETLAQYETVPGTAKNEFSSDDFEEPEETEPEETEAKVTEPEETEPKETEPKETESKETEPETTEPGEDDDRVTYEEYNNMSPEDQMEFFNRFASMEDFLAWYNQAKDEYEEEHGSIDIEDGNIDLGDIVKPKE